MDRSGPRRLVKKRNWKQANLRVPMFLDHISLTAGPFHLPSLVHGKYHTTPTGAEPTQDEVHSSANTGTT